MDIFNLATVDFLSVVADDVVEVVLVEIGEGEIIADFHGGSLLVEIKELDVLVYFPISSVCGLTLRSGYTTPLMQKLPSEGVPFSP